MMARSALTQPYSLGDSCTVAYLHRGGMLASNATVTAVRQLPHGNGWMVTVRTHSTGLEIDTEVSCDGRAQFLAHGYNCTDLPDTPHHPAGLTPTTTTAPPVTMPAAEAQIIITARGSQTPAVSTHTRQPGDGRPAVLVTYAGTITVCHGPVAVGRRARAWLAGIELADEGHLPEVNRSSRFTDPVSFSTGVVASEDIEPVQVSGHGAGNGRGGHADVIVRVGALSVRCLDRQALVSIAAAWADADRLARIVWGAESIANRTRQ